MKFIHQIFFFFFEITIIVVIDSYGVPVVKVVEQLSVHYNILLLSYSAPQFKQKNCGFIGQKQLI